MRLLDRILGLGRAPAVTAAAPADRPARVGVRRDLAARYDAAQTTDDNRRHWAAADGLSPDAAAAPQIRRVLRNRARYEVANNSYAKGIVGTIANDVVGTGPLLQLQTDDADLNTAAEQDWAAWAEEVGLAAKLRCLRAARCDAGEGFGLMATNPGLASDVKLDVRLVEADQVADPLLGLTFDTPQQLDGISYDGFGNPTSYRVLRHHPGSTFYMGLGTDYDDWPARYVLHHYRPDRPGQRRGVPELTPALPLFAQLRRYTLAVIAAAETAADYAAVIWSDAPADGDGAEPVDAMDTFELQKRMATVLPQGWKLGQMSAEQPTTTYGDFVWTLLREVARCLNLPLTIAALDSSRSNLSAAYLDHQTYAKSVLIDRGMLEGLLNRLVDAWLTEWIRVRRPGRIPDRFPRQWRWPSVGQHADPAKVANAQTAKLANGTTSLPREFAKEGLDWEAEQASAAKALGISLDDYRALLRQKLFGPAGSPAAGGAGDDKPDDTKPDDGGDDDAAK